GAGTPHCLRQQDGAPDNRYWGQGGERTVDNRGVDQSRVEPRVNENKNVDQCSNHGKAYMGGPRVFLGHHINQEDDGQDRQKKVHNGNRSVVKSPPNLRRTTGGPPGPRCWPRWCWRFHPTLRW